MAEVEEWRPGSFTKNFSWGQDGLYQLHRIIAEGFNFTLRDVPRSEFRARVEKSGRPEYIPLNFFLFNKPIDGVDHLIADELVFQALTSPPSPRFDKLALFAFNLSRAGRFRGATPSQRRPALWAQHYVMDRLNEQLHWNASLISADDIQQFVMNDPRYKAETSRKLATNLNFLYSIGHLAEFADPRVERWWVDALFLTLDRTIEDGLLDGRDVSEATYPALLLRSNFHKLSRQSLEKDLAARHLVSLYTACGSRNRFSDDAVKELTQVTLPDVEWMIANDTRPQGAVHPSNPRILKSIPRACAMLARYAGFDIIDAEELENFDIEAFIKNHTRRALENLRRDEIRAAMSAEEIFRITREK